MQYDFTAIEAKWQAAWAERGTFCAPNPGDDGFDADKPKYYVLAMFPYPSGAGMHMGHALNYTSTDIPARYRRMSGYNVLHPIGYDAFGLPAEQYAIETGTHPAVTTQQNIDNITRQFNTLGISFDWGRCISTTEPDYYKWTQWIFLRLYHSWFDPQQDKATPISELIDRLADEHLLVTPDGQVTPHTGAGLEGLQGDPIGLIKWHELDPETQRSVVGNHRLAYMAEVEVNWCPALGTVLANEEVTNDGRSERGNHPVFKRSLKQWMLRITAFADRLLADLENVDWPEPIKIMQRNWIGRSEGAQVDFPVESSDQIITVFTTRPDTLFGATYMVLAPEHPLVDEVTTADQRDTVKQYQQQAASRSDIDRQAEAKEKTGVFTGGFAINPTNSERIPIWIADYVMMGYGTGAIMAVPGHDERDYAFAKTFDLEIREVVVHDQDPRRGDLSPPASEAFTGEGFNVNSANDEISLNGLPTPEAKQNINDWLAHKGLGQEQVQYKLRDWLFSRQRYWGEPFPVLHGPDGEIVAVDEADLPVELPPMQDFTPHAGDDPDADVQTPLSRAPDAWKQVNGYTRELNTMPQWAGSCWYYLRFLDANNDGQFVGPEAEKYWMLIAKKPGGTGGNHAGGVDLYVGGVEHAVLHLLYARFWHKVLFDLDHVSTPEPFGKLFNQGYIQAHYYEDDRGVRVPADEVEQRDDQWFYDGKPVKRHMGKMGKSLKNSVTPDQVVSQYGADTLRLFLMYLGPLDQSKLWNPQDIAGLYRFLQRLWRNFVGEDGALLVNDEPPTDDLNRLLHKTIKRVTDDMDAMRFNTAIAAIIELNNQLVQLPALPRQVAQTAVLLLSPMAPHICEELWQKLGHDQSLAYETWPVYDPALLVEETVEYPIAINGKVRGRFTVAADADDDALEAAARADEHVAAMIEGKTVRKVIVVKGRMVNFVVS